MLADNANLEIGEDVRGMTIARAARYVGVSEDTIYRLRDRGKLTIRKIMGRNIILRDDLDRILGVSSANDQAEV